jgi:hypothetical protein
MPAGSGHFCEDVIVYVDRFRNLELTFGDADPLVFAYRKRGTKLPE